MILHEDRVEKDKRNYQAKKHSAEKRTDTAYETWPVDDEMRHEDADGRYDHTEVMSSEEKETMATMLCGEVATSRGVVAVLNE